MYFRIAALVVTSAVAACAKAPSCNDRSALQLLAQNGYAKLGRIVTVSASNSADYSKCRADNGSTARVRQLEYRVFRSPEGNVIVDVGTS